MFLTWGGESLHFFPVDIQVDLKVLEGSSIVSGERKYFYVILGGGWSEKCDVQRLFKYIALVQKQGQGEAHPLVSTEQKTHSWPDLTS